MLQPVLRVARTLSPPRHREYGVACPVSTPAGATGTHPLCSRRARPRAVLSVVILAACANDVAAPAELRHAVVVTVATSGSSPDTDGYTVTLGSEQRTLEASGTATFESLAPGSYDVRLGGVAPNCTVVGSNVVVATVTEGQGASVAFEVDCPFDGAGVALPEVVCPLLSAAAVEGVPIDVMPIGGVPSSFDRPILARMSWPGGRRVSLALVEEDGGDATMMIPLHPSGSLEGGDVTVRISDETQTCLPFTFSILPLPTAEGELADFVAVAQALLDEQAVLFDTTREELLGTPMSELEPALRMEAIAQVLVDGPSGESSLRALAEGTAPDFGSADLDFVERLLARTGLRADLEATLAEIQAVPARSALAGAPARALSPGIALECMTALDMDAQLLSDCMTLARDKAQGSASEKTQDNAIFAMDVAATLGSRMLAGPISSAITFSKLYDRAIADNLPSSFVSLDVAPKPAEFLEDQTGPGTWAPALATAVSNGWDLNELLIELIVGRVTPDLRPIGKRLSYLEKWIIKRGDDSGLFADILLVENFFQGLLEMVADKLGELGVDLTDGVLTVPPREYGPVDITDTEWTDAQIVTGTSVALTPHELYQPQEPGTSFLEVITAIGKFGGTNIVTDPIPISVGKLSISIEPSEILLEAAQETTLTVTVTNSLHPDSVELLPEHPVQGTAVLSLGAADTHTVTYTAPDAPVPGSADLVAVHHIAQGGARGVSSEARSASATIRFGSLTIFPRSGCVDPGRTLQFSAELVGFSPDEVVWEADVGDIDERTGLYTAPSSVPAGSEAKITARIGQSEAVMDEVSITIGCVCSFSVRVWGNTLSDLPGYVVSYNVYADGGVFDVSLTSPSTIADPLATTADLTLYFTSDPPAAAPGTYTGGIIHSTFGAPSTDLGYGGELTIVVEEYTPERSLRGYAVGEVITLAGPTSSFEFSFQILVSDEPLGWPYACVVP